VSRKIRLLLALWPLFAAWQLAAWTDMARAEGAEGIFYVSPKLMVGKQKTSYEAPALEVRDTGNRFPGQAIPRVPAKHMGAALQAEDSQIFGAVAFGADFYHRFEIPIRLELEISTKSDAKSQGERVERKEAGYESEQGYIQITSKSVAYTIHTAFVNAYADWHNESRFTPYVGGGLGAAFIEGRATICAGSNVGVHVTYPDGGGTQGGFGGCPINSTGEFDFKKRATNFAWHLDAGVSFNLTEKAAIELGYRYLDVGKPLELGSEPAQIPFASLNTQILEYGPKEIVFEPTHQLVLGFRYSF